MDLILWRHAEAEDTAPDIDRVLTAKGRQQAARMATWLKQRCTGEIMVLASPAKRTQQTAAALDMPFQTLQALAPGATAQQLLAAVDWPNHAGTVIVVGHQPTLGMAAAHLLSGSMQYWSVKKGAIWWLSSRIRGTEQQVVLRSAMTPDQL